MYAFAFSDNPEALSFALRGVKKSWILGKGNRYPSPIGKSYRK
jgi:hypothetical protein